VAILPAVGKRRPAAGARPIQRRHHEAQYDEREQ